MSTMSMDELLKLSQQFTQSDALDDLMTSISQSVAASATAKLGDAILSIRDAGEDPSDYIPKSKSAMRAKAAAARLQMQQEQHAQQLRQQQELHELEVRRITAGIVQTENFVASQSA